MEKGWIALDIDGTTTSNVFEIPDETVKSIAHLQQQGWKIFFITGRVYAWALQTVEPLPFPFYFAVQNGADIFEMPSKKLLSRAYLSSDIVLFLQEAYTEIPGDFLIYSGYEKGDFCYFRPSRFSDDVTWYLDVLKEFSPRPW